MFLDKASAFQRISDEYDAQGRAKNDIRICHLGRFWEGNTEGRTFIDLR